MTALPFFVYGTLKRGEVREHSWPHPPLQVQAACTPGLLYDLGDYPALRLGAGIVGGELWKIASDHIPLTLQVLDEIEGYQGRDDDLYTRRVVAVSLLGADSASSAIQAYVYTYNDTHALDRLEPVSANDAGIAYWFGSR